MSDGTGAEPWESPQGEPGAPPRVLAAEHEGFDQWVVRKIEWVEGMIRAIEQRIDIPVVTLDALHDTITPLVNRVAQLESRPYFFGAGFSSGSGARRPISVGGCAGGGGAAVYDPMQAPVSKRRILDKMAALADDYYAPSTDDGLPRAWIELRNFIELA